MTKTISVAEARKHFAEITNGVAFQGHEYLILKNGKEVARLVPPAQVTVPPHDLKGWLDATADQYQEDLSALASL